LNGVKNLLGINGDRPHFLRKRTFSHAENGACPHLLKSCKGISQRDWAGKLYLS